MDSFTSTDDTIVAIATPPGRGGIGVVRLSGKRAIEIALRLIRIAKPSIETQHSTLGEFCEAESGRVLDQVVVTCFRQPHSYTAEEVVEISCHGAPVILRHLVERCLAEGARAAEPGEFTLRAFLNGRIDLTQAEAIRDLIASQTLLQARVAAQQMEGAVAARLKPHKQKLLNLIAKLEAGIDFAEDDIPVSGWAELSADLEAVRCDLDQLIQSYRYGRILHGGLSLAIVGRPNVGKSSLFNRLLNADRAIVTAMPGTTRDLVAESASIDGIPLRFVDTAGIRHTQDEAEKLGVEKSMQAIADSDLRLLVVDSSQGWTRSDAEVFEKVRPLGALVVALNKSDLLRPESSGTAPRILEAEIASLLGANEAPAALVATSALTGEGLPELKQKILEVAAPGRDLGPEDEFITNLRQQQLLDQSVSALDRAREAVQQRTPHEMLLLDVYDALRSLDTLTGATYVDDVLGIIFSTFCVGK